MTNYFKKRWQEHQLKKEFADHEKSIVKEIYKKCNYDAVKCRVAMTNIIVDNGLAMLREGCRVATNRCVADTLPPRNMGDHVIYDIPCYQETSNSDDLSYANATNVNTTDRQKLRSEDPYRRSTSYQRPGASGVEFRACGSCDHERDAFDEDDIPPNDIGSPEPGYDVPGERIATSDLPEHLLILSPRPLHRITVVQRPGASGVEFRACGSCDHERDAFDEDDIPPNDIGSPEPGYDVPGERIATSDLPEHLLILSPRPLHRITVVQRPGASGVEFRACGSCDHEVNEGTLYAPERPKLSNGAANVYASTLFLPRSSVHRREVQDARRQISTSAPQSNSADRNSKPHESFYFTSGPASSNSNLQSLPDLLSPGPAQSTKPSAQSRTRANALSSSTKQSTSRLMPPPHISNKDQ
ncbi:expressed protein [Echinococcus multilocularis]|uniref:Expressed protein n=1 Tax=Echinococcus multilocularis TaxID=6211 RepID=A0A068Y4U6_ECHMU|nr:expressed protein [Echinococcus multilocularis]